MATRILKKTKTGRYGSLLNRALLRVRSRLRRGVKFFAVIRLHSPCCLRRSFALGGVGLAHHSRTFWVGFGSWWAAGRLCLLPLRMGTRLRGCDICICSSLCATLTCGWSHPMEGAGGHGSHECLALLLGCSGAGCHSLLGYHSAQADGEGLSCFLTVASWGPLP